jgi:hypothetical protein
MDASLLAILRRRRAGGGLGAAVQSILSGTAGFARDPIAANLFQDTAGATPVVNAADPVGRFNCQWGNAPPNWQQATGGSRPTWDGTGLAYDGAAGHMTPLSNTDIFNNVPGAFHCERILCTDLALARHIFAFSNGLNPAAVRFAGLINTTGSVALQSRRLDADGQNTATTATGLITAGVAAVISWQVDWAGTGLAKIWINGTEVVSTAVSGSVANSEATSSLRQRDGINLSSSLHFGWKRRSVTCPFIPSDASRAAVEAWVGAS